MGRRFQEQDLDDAQRKAALVERAEALAGSEDWRRTPRLFREMAGEWRQIDERGNAQDGDPLLERFHRARQTFMDRRAEWFQEGADAIGAATVESLDDLHERIETVRAAVHALYVRLGELEKRLDTGGLADDERRRVTAGMAALREEVTLKEMNLRGLESGLIASGQGFCGY